MLKQLYRLTTPWGLATPWQLFKNRALGRAVNYVYPLHAAFLPIKKPAAAKGGESRVIVSLTTFPKRADKAHLCINSILRQTRPADMVLVFLAKDEFPSEESVPEPIRRLRDEKLIDLRFCPNVRSYKKILYAAREFADDIIITADDDALYPENWIERLLALHAEYPNCVCCYRACEITLDENNLPKPYITYPKLSNGIKGPDFLLMPTGVGGVLYPPKAFEGIELDEKKIAELCPNADDVWLHAVMMKKGIPTVKVNPHSTEWFTVLGSQRWSIKDENIVENCPNDVAMRNLIKELGLDFAPFARKEAK